MNTTDDQDLETSTDIEDEDRSRPGGTAVISVSAGAEIEVSEPSQAAEWFNSTEPWLVVHTKPRQEKALARTLDARQIPCYLPVVTQRRTYGHRRRTVEIPLFTGYLFMRGGADARYAAIDSKRTATIIPVVDQRRLDHELRQIHRAVSQQATLDPYPFITRGRPVRVKSGVFAGMEGLVDIRRTDDRIILIVQTIGQATSLEIDAGLLEPIDWKNS